MVDVEDLPRQPTVEYVVTFQELRVADARSNTRLYRDSMPHHAVQLVLLFTFGFSGNRHSYIYRREHCTGRLRRDHVEQ